MFKQSAKNIVALNLLTGYLLFFGFFALHSHSLELLPQDNIREANGQNEGHCLVCDYFIHSSVSNFITENSNGSFLPEPGFKQLLFSQYENPLVSVTYKLPSLRAPPGYI